MKNNIKIVYVMICILGIIAVRVFENQWFYDPLIHYFKNDFYNNPIPNMDQMALYFGLTLRYFCNSLLSIIILFLVFKDLNLTKFSAILYLFFYILLIITFFTLLHFDANNQKMFLFYVRRFLIQPIFLLLFLPAFYYQKKQK
ncbi:exosortase F system-associated membrane protein [Flavobacterium branchiophilum]|uniref:Exosortase F system-associated protein n=1 Tax=Flavobacterium branchiophilum (strain FL-15) TaxID=1034807 RepID=G2Z2G4_FLABF|nr:Probable transmembrane protein of unknown function [Flavobacterium branchiophilum FL-15]